MSHLEYSEDWIDLEQLALQRRSAKEGWQQRVDRILQMLKTFPPRQVATRIVKRSRQRLGWTRSPVPRTSSVQIRGEHQFQRLFQSELAKRAVGLANLAGGKLCLLNDSRGLGYPFDWTASLKPRPGHLWRFQLHYQEYLLDLVKSGPAAEVDQRWELAWEIVNNWIEKHPSPDAHNRNDAWHPYCISRRVPVWLKLLAGDPGTPILHGHRNQIEDHLYLQLDGLSGELETDLRGNHLLENLHALGMGASYFEGPPVDAWLSTVERMLESELMVQLLPHGEHFERSPMYHCVVTSNLIQLSIAMQSASPSLAEKLRLAAGRMVEFLESLLLPDGEIPLLSDSCFGEAASVEQIRTLARLTNLPAPQSGNERDQGTQRIGDYWIHRREQDLLLLDAGPVAAPQLPAHGHCDCLGLVGSIAGQRFLVDSGNGSYDLDRTRTYCRSSVAHNVATVDEIDHCDVWSKFRMGRRPAVSPISTGGRAPFSWVKCRHNAYRSIGVPWVTRWVAACQDALFWICLDHFETRNDHRLEGFLHFADSVQLLPSTAPDGQWHALHAGQTLKLGWLGASRISPAHGWICHEFGKKTKSPGVVYSASSDECSVLGWFVCHESTDIQWGESKCSLTIQPSGTTGSLDLALPFSV